LLRDFLSWLVTVISVFLAIAAILGAMITMNAAVANRQREIGTLRALGFGRGTILLSFLVESVLLSLAGGAVGVAAAMALGLVQFSTVNWSSWSEVVFSFEPTSGMLLGALIVATVMGLVGGLLPALRASRVSPVDAMRA
jgi:putative ABC transport system permease protein